MGDEATESLLDGLAESTRRAARTQGYAVGWAEGRRAAVAAADLEVSVVTAQLAEDRRRQEQEHQEALEALRSLATELRAAMHETCTLVEGQAAELALQLTHELVGARAADAGSHAVARVTSLLPEHTVVRARLHPDVAASASSLVDAGVQVVADPGLGRADAVAETDAGVLDLQITTALERLREVLS
jgi:flagellar assembly protein FliH